MIIYRGMKGKVPGKEKPTPLGDRVYPKHRKMQAAIAKRLRIGRAEVIRRAIEEMHDRVVAAA